MSILARIVCFALMVFCAGCGGGALGHGVHNDMSLLVLQLAIIIFAARIAGMLFYRLRLPSVIGELCAGILIGPYLLGSLPLPGLPEGLFPISAGALIPVSNELYGLAVIASILLLFSAGLETDLSMLRKFSVSGLTIGVIGAVVSFCAGIGVTAWYSGHHPLHPACLFMGAVCTATSIGITTRVLHDTKKAESPEGVIIHAGAFLDDTIGIVLLAVIIGTAVVPASGPPGEPGQVTGLSFVVGRAFLVWIGFMVLGLIFASRIAAFLKRFKSITVFSVMSFGLALLIAGIFERAGLAMIIGAYVCGLTLSKTDIRYVIVDRLRTIQAFLVPVFFVVMGMFVNLSHVMSGASLVFAVTFTIAAISAKIAGCGLPALFLGFNRLGALRIGIGLAPRSEVALIIAGMGLASGILSDNMFAATAMMVLFSALLAPSILERLLKKDARGTRVPVSETKTVAMKYDFPSSDIADFVALKILDYFAGEDFFVLSSRSGHSMHYRLNRNSTSVSLVNSSGTLVLETAQDSVVFVKTLVYEALLNIHEIIGKIKHLAKPDSMRREITQGDRGSANIVSGMITRSCLRAELKADTKDGIIEELFEILARAGLIDDRAVALGDIMEREASMSTGMQYGIALPHAITLGVSRMCVAVGLKKEGTDFQSLDGLPSRIFIMLLSPKNISGPHIQFLTGISAMLSAEKARQKLLACETEEQMFRFFRNR